MNRSIASTVRGTLGEGFSYAPSVMATTSSIMNMKSSSGACSFGWMVSETTGARPRASGGGRRESRETIRQPTVAHTSCASTSLAALPPLIRIL